MSKLVRSIAYRVLSNRQGTDRPACEICGVVESDRPLCVDHDHTTGAMRGLLCNNCNAGIGLLGDCPSRIELAAAYLRRHATTLGTERAV